MTSQFDFRDKFISQKWHALALLGILMGTLWFAHLS